MESERWAARALLVSPKREILLMRIQIPGTKRLVWITPGGGLHDGEDAEPALRRELEEETGLTDVPIGPEVWTRTSTFRWLGVEITRHERFFWIPIDHFEPTADRMPHELERDIFDGFRWWPIDEIHTSRERFAPRSLGDRLRELLEAGPPPRPIDVGL